MNQNVFPGKSFSEETIGANTGRPEERNLDGLGKRHGHHSLKPHRVSAPCPHLKTGLLKPGTPGQISYRLHPAPARRMTPSGSFLSPKTRATPYMPPPKNPVVRYCVFRGYMYGLKAEAASVNVQQTVAILRDRENPQDSKSLKVVIQRSQKAPRKAEMCLDSGTKTLGHCDVMTRDLLTEILDRRAGILIINAVVCDFDEEVEDPPEGMFVAQLRVSVFGPIFSIDNMARYFNSRIKIFELELYFYQQHNLFNVKTLEEQEEEEFINLLHRAPTKNCKAQDSKTLDSADFHKAEGDFRQIFGSSNKSADIESTEPSPLLKTSMLPHQKIGLGWMIQREKPRKDKSLFWKKIEARDGYSYWQNEITGTRTTNAPEEFRGGILADDMGLGKTLQAIALIATRDFGVGPTLVVCPVSVMNNWKLQVEEHVEENSFKITVYHGPNRKTDKKALEDYDVVITSYSVVSFEWSAFGPQKKSSQNEKALRAAKRSKKSARSHAFGGGHGAVEQGESSESPSSSDEESDFEFSKGVHAVQWMRVVLDEAHKIRSQKSKMHKAICSLWTERRWCLTGTPIQNKLDDFYALIRFLQVHPLNEVRFWKSVILNPLKIQDPDGLKKLWAIREYLVLRRTKTCKIDGKPIVSLPRKFFNDIVLDFDPQALRVYSALTLTSQRSIQAAEKSLGKSNAFIFAVITRLRQYCGHPQLVPEDYVQKASMQANLPASFQSVKEALEELLDGESICFICNKPAIDPCVTPCFHVYCQNCVLNDLMMKLCPICKRPFEVDELFIPKNSDRSGGSEDKNSQSNRIKRLALTDELLRCPKIDRLLADLDKPFDTSGRKDKTVVFSQWVKMLDIIEYHLNKAGKISVRVDGSKSSQARDLAFRSFQSEEEVEVILISLGAGGEGINLTAANRLYLIDPWWNPASEDQAIDRVHRLGQTRDVQINRMFMKNSIEEKVKELQKKKRQLVRGTFESQNNTVFEQRMLLSEIKNLV